MDLEGSQPGVKGADNVSKGRKKTAKRRRGRGKGCRSASSVASWATGFMSNSDVSLISNKPRKVYSGSYDIRYTSTGLILLNNRMREQMNHLRQSDTPQANPRRPIMDPERHSRATSVLSLSHHMHCCDSTTPRPEFSSSPSVRWLKRVTPARILEKYSVNQKRHKGCIPVPEKTFVLDSSLPVLAEPEKQSGYSPYAATKTKKRS